jgi:hypothetical protein
MLRIRRERRKKQLIGELKRRMMLRGIENLKNKMKGRDRWRMINGRRCRKIGVLGMLGYR